MQLHLSPNIRSIFLLLTAVAALPAEAATALSNSPNGSVSYSSLVPTFENGAYTVNGLRFTTGSEASEISDVMIPLRNESGTLDLTTIFAEVWTATGADGYKGSQLFASATTSLVGGNAFQFTFGDNLLAAGTQYWIVYRSTTEPTVDNLQQFYLVGGSALPTAAQSQSSFSSDLGWIVDGAETGRSDGPTPTPSNGLATVWSISASPIPEPGSVLAASIPVILMALRRRRSAEN